MTNPPSLRQLLATRGNDHRPHTSAFEHRTGLGWHTPTPPDTPAAPLSVVIPAHNVAHCLPRVLDALQHQRTAGQVEVIVVDDASTDDTPRIITGHPRVDLARRLPRRAGAASARNLGVALASAQTVVFVDADMVLPEHVLADMGARATAEAVLVGFRHNHPAHLPPPASGDRPDLYADHRVSWRPPAGVPLMYSGTVVEEGRVFHPLDETEDLWALGHGALYYDWDLSRMVVTALVGVPRQAVLEVGGFDPRFGQVGWGCEDTHLGAKLIAHGLLVIPVRQAVGFHLDPPDAEEQWKGKLASWAATMHLYRRHLDQPVPDRGAALFNEQVCPLVDVCEVLR
ncbi:glycosyltransferase family 2 protein [Nocardiopsis alborubida]|uniref:Glycosyltransferase family 2 protein n=1 Tax=Nocardiopsis alborubida TaxID=146802 RepID=A0A7X6M928_9ACTN|nr:glycosyltransferase family 2 protein [Nocardiopsis alborubida]NKY96635.1 glycosyltransferase family 2 protein [Nocardiopsis alborubida]